MRGEYLHSVDAKGRMIFPAKLREELGEGFVIFKGLDGCICVYSKEDWDAFEKKIAGLPVVRIGASAFEGNTALTTVDLPDCIQTIGTRAFANCTNLSEIK